MALLQRVKCFFGRHDRGDVLLIGNYFASCDVSCKCCGKLFPATAQEMFKAADILREQLFKEESE